ncbi:MAG: sigma 54-interacting transcriptional regulator [Desulfovibrio sp.]|nr:sigma 54-interacting transcriptional regulator [Desulfovibrio sp.]
MSEKPFPKAEDRLKMLHELAELMHSFDDIARALDLALELMAKHLAIRRGSITLISPESGEIRTEASYGITASERKLGTYQRGEGITGRVVESGTSMAVSNVRSDPRFLNRTGARDLSREAIGFCCVPIMLNGQVVGALSVDSEDTRPVFIQMLEIAASLLAHAAMEWQSRMDSHRSASKRPEGFIGQSSEMENVYQLIHQVADSSATVLLQGESGTGKELCARALHTHSARAKGPFISLNCAALPEQLIESELFGHEKGAFTGAQSQRKGRFELAHTGTLFLDEIGELPLTTQAKLLRVLQEKQFERVGGSQTLSVDVRFITATHRDLLQMVAEGSFRQDLFYRINVFPIFLPPLRKRSEDILPLCQHFLKKFAHENGTSPPRISSKAMDLLQRYAWPGNVRELENVLLRAVLLLGQEKLITQDHLPTLLSQSPEEQALTNQGGDLPSRLAQLEKAAMIQALEQSRGRIRTACTLLGLTPRIFAYKMRKYQLNYQDFRHKAALDPTSSAS